MNDFIRGGAKRHPNIYWDKLGIVVAGVMICKGAKPLSEVGESSNNSCEFSHGIYSAGKSVTNDQKCKEICANYL